VPRIAGDMARNVRGDRVVHPDHVIDYDLLHPGGPLVIGFGTACFTAFAGITTAIAAAALPVSYLMGVPLTAAVATIGGTLALRLHETNRERRAELSRDLGALRHLVAYDETRIDEAVLWDASTLAHEFERLDDEVERIASKPIQAILQREWLMDAREQKELLGRRILQLTETATDVPAL